MRPQILALLSSRPMIPGSFGFSPHFGFGDSTQLVHLYPIPSDEGCSQHFGSTKSTFRHQIHSDLKNVAARLNSKLPVIQVPPPVGAVPPPQLRHPGQPANHAVAWKEFAVSLPSHHDCMFDPGNAESYGFRFSAAIPTAKFTLQSQKGDQSKPQGGAAGPLQFQGMSTSQKKRAKRRAKEQASRAVDEESGVEVFLKPSDIARVRMFLCFNADVQGGKLPAVNMEINPLRPLRECIADFFKKFSSHK